MALKGVLRPGYIQIRVTDLDAALAHYVDRVGCTRSAVRPMAASTCVPGTNLTAIASFSAQRICRGWTMRDSK